MNYMLLTPVNTNNDPAFIKTKVLINLNKVHDISASGDGTVIDFGGDEAVWIVAESVEDMTEALNAAQLLINI